ncbi:hypothetical protein A3K69_02990 [Candidatus Bathyarchaeota archaeon RBG_16_57_9]|nr:MAG: hypothetical protein A3K69_02990 [Candidatus Bathyarchaeota archaeon RBG_16_57_9]
MAKKPEEIKQHVRERYGAFAEMSQASCGCGCGSGSSSSCCGSEGNYAQNVGYSDEELKNVPEAAVSSCAACGNPTAIAGLKEGETVLDLGSGGGMDAILAAQKVGPKGKVIGVDMTPEMIKLAQKNVKATGLSNVEFRRGEIENLPLEDGTMDVIISNCVINLSPDKDTVFSEAYRVLRPGGRITVSDIVTEGKLPEEVLNDPDSWAACVSGALETDEYLGKIRAAGFEDVRVLSKRGSDPLYSAEVYARKPL